MTQIGKEIQGKNYLAKEIDAKDARKIVKQYHYSGKVVSNSKIHLGLFAGGGISWLPSIRPTYERRQNITKNI